MTPCEVSLFNRMSVASFVRPRPAGFPLVRLSPSKVTAFLTRSLQDKPEIWLNDMNHIIKANSSTSAAMKDEGFELNVSNYIHNYECRVCWMYMVTSKHRHSTFCVFSFHNIRCIHFLVEKGVSFFKDSVGNLPFWVMVFMTFLGPDMLNKVTFNNISSLYNNIQAKSCIEYQAFTKR